MSAKEAGVLLLWTVVSGTSLAQPSSCGPLAPSHWDAPAWQGCAVLGSSSAQPLLAAGKPGSPQGLSSAHRLGASFCPQSWDGPFIRLQGRLGVSGQPREQGGLSLLIKTTAPLPVSPALFIFLAFTQAHSLSLEETIGRCTHPVSLHEKV